MFEQDETTHDILRQIARIIAIGQLSECALSEKEKDRLILTIVRDLAMDSGADEAEDDEVSAALRGLRLESRRERIDYSRGGGDS